MGSRSIEARSQKVDRITPRFPSDFGVQWLAVGFIVIGVAARTIVPGRLAVEHFDEGVYASNIWFNAEQHYQYPMRHLYAPPLLPGLIEVVQLVSGTESPLVPLVPTMIAGIGTIFLVWRWAKVAFGETHGLLALIVAATAPFHIEYTRTALTDALLCFWLIWSLALLVDGISNRRLVTSVGAGVLAGLAWWTKYNGWLTLAIGGTGIALASLFDRTCRSQLRHHLTHWSISAVVATVLWIPVLWSLQSFGGYSVVAANHRRYLMGLDQWFQNASQQFQNVSHYDSVLGWSGLFLAIVVACRARLSMTAEHRERWTPPLPWTHTLSFASITGLIAMVQGSTAILVMAAGCGAVSWLSSSRRIIRSEREVLTFWLIAVWFGSLLLATPSYRPYPRLLLPWLISTWLLSAVGLFEITNRVRQIVSAKPQPRRSWTWPVAIVTCLFMFAALGHHIRSAGFAIWQDRTGMLKVAEQIANHIRAPQNRTVNDATNASQDAAVWVYGEPAIFYHLRRLGVSLANPTVKLAEPSRLATEMKLRSYCVVGPHAQRSADFQNEWKDVGSQFEKTAEFMYETSDIVRLDHYSPRDLNSASNDDRVLLYLWTGPKP